MPSRDPFAALNRRITACTLCPRLRAYCADVGRVKRAAFRDETYWARPVPNFGESPSGLLIVGLAPAAHGANRTGRMFTGDRSGEWLYRALYRAGFASRGESRTRDDGLQLRECTITAVCHCAPPDNKPLPAEIVACRGWLAETFSLVRPRVVLALGQIAWRAAAMEAKARGWRNGPQPKFGHLAHVHLDGERHLIGSYHPSQQNTFTGRLTQPMFDRVFTLARKLLG